METLFSLPETEGKQLCSLQYDYRRTVLSGGAERKIVLGDGEEFKNWEEC